MMALPRPVCVCGVLVWGRSGLVAGIAGIFRGGITGHTRKLKVLFKGKFDSRPVPCLPPTSRRDVDIGSSMLLPLLPLFAALDAQAEPPLLGRLFQARIDVHEMGRAELTEALSERGTTYGAQESEDVLRIRLYQARAALLDSRSAHLAHAERVMNEATEHSTFEFLSGNTLDTILAAGQHVEKRRPGGATAHAPGRLRRPLQAPGCATHPGRAAETLRAQWQAAARP